MKRLFGGKKEVKEGPSLNDATDTTNKRVEVLDAKIKNCEKELLDYKGKLKAARPGPAQANLKKRALAVLNQKRMYERQRDQVPAPKPSPGIPQLDASRLCHCRGIGSASQHPSFDPPESLTMIRRPSPARSCKVWLGTWSR